MTHQRNAPVQEPTIVVCYVCGQRFTPFAQGATSNCPSCKVSYPLKEVSSKASWLTASDWVKCADSSRMLRYLRQARKASPRKLRLFSCACCRLIWHLLIDPKSCRAVEMSELYADGLVDVRELQSAYDTATPYKL